MKLTNHRLGWSITGEYVTLIRANVIPTDDELLAYWHLRPGQLRYADHARAFPHVRVILRKHNGNFVIVPVTKGISEIYE